MTDNSNPLTAHKKESKGILNLTIKQISLFLLALCTTNPNDMNYELCKLLLTFFSPHLVVKIVFLFFAFSSIRISTFHDGIRVGEWCNDDSG